jgi:hypothetical protein
MTLRLTSNPGVTRIVDPATGKQRTATHVSTNINILVNGVAVGAIKKINVKEARDISKIAEVGSDAIIDSAPKSATQISGGCTRTRFDGQRIAEAFMRGFVHVAAQRTPFDIEIQDSFKGDAASGAMIVTTVRNVWITDIGYTYSADDFIIVDDMNWTAESIDSILSSGGSVVGAVNSRGIPLVVNIFEQSADMGQFRGALDGPGLLNAIEGSTL